uniref:FAD-binding PCMH-type domain-containing protein n=1 Tax=Oryza nivara TaxID=4536 RepID=A0A0E0HS74_ORYNI
MSRFKTLLLFIIFCIFSSCYIPSPAIASDHDPSSKGFIHCLTKKSIPPWLIHKRSSSSYTPILKSSIRNPKFLNTTASTTPLCIVMAKKTSHIQAAVVCGRRHRVRVRARSGGHDYEGLSYRAEGRLERFAVVDLSGMRSVRVDAARGTAWVQSGATLGELYHAIWSSAPRLGFAAGVCPTVGVGGHFSGGGFGMLQRKYGLAVDHVVNATLVDARGDLLGRDAMGEDLFWAIRGGGGGSFGIVVSWHIKLVPVPPTVTVFDVVRTPERGAIDVLTKWQEIAPRLPDDIMVRVIAEPRRVTFEAMYLGTCDELLPLMHHRFPDLAMQRADCNEMTWIESIPYIHLGSNATVADILNRSSISRVNTKNRSDYVRQPIPKSIWKKIFAKLQQLTNFGEVQLFIDPYGAKISRIHESATPFPHREGVLYNIQYITYWNGDANGTLALKWSRDLYKFMEPYVSKNPREAYANYRDLDLGRNKVVNGISSYHHGKVWGEKYFRANFERLAKVKAMVDPDDYFRNEQSIPPLFE